MVDTVVDTVVVVVRSLWVDLWSRLLLLHPIMLGFLKVCRLLLGHLQLDLMKERNRGENIAYAKGCPHFPIVNTLCSVSAPPKDLTLKIVVPQFVLPPEIFVPKMREREREK